MKAFGQNRISQNDLGAELNIQHYSVPRSELINFIAKGNVSQLHGGEQECLFLCQQRELSLLLTDDMAVRDAARRLKLVPVGSLGIVVAAYERELISRQHAERYIADLYDVSSLFVTRDLVDLAIENLRLHPKH